MLSRRALVTGASEGIGRAFAHRLAREGYAVTAVARNRERLAALVGELGEGHEAVVADLANPVDTAEVAARLSGGRFDLLVNNAGVGSFGRFEDVDLDAHLALLRLNVHAVVVLAHAFLRQAQRGDALVNLSSTVAQLPIPACGLYPASKSFVATFSECLWYEQRRRGVYVVGLLPGPTETDFQRRAGAGHHQPPRALLQTPDQVVAEAMAALRARKRPTVMTGRPNRIFAFLGRFRSRRAVVSQMGNLFPET